MILPYIVNTAIMLGACLAFYKLLLRRETFYRANRYLLILCVAISFALPVLKMPQQFSLRKIGAQTNNEYKVQQQQSQLPSLSAKESTHNLENNQAKTTVNVAQQPEKDDRQTSTAKLPTFSLAQLMTWLFWFYWFGVAIFAASFIFQVGLLIYRSYRSPVIIDGRYRIIEVAGDKAPCSFGNIIFINPEKYEWETYSQILLHEKVHVRQKHSIDILIAELVLIFQWFNPFAWMYRREIENNLEFLTDDQLMQQRIDKKSYQLSLVKVSAPHLPLSLTTNYNQSILKKRIAMMNSKRSNLHTAWKYFFLMPILAFLACLLNEPTAKSQTSSNDKHVKNVRNHDVETEGSWFATLKGDKISIQLRNDDDTDNDHSFNGNTYRLSDFTPEPKEGVTAFKMSRDAGTVDFTGRIESNTGMGHYKFTPDKAYGDAMNSQLKEKLDDRDQFVFFLVNVKKDYVSMLKNQGYADVTKDNIIPLAALKVDQPFIQSLKNTGFKDISLENLVTFKALGIDDKYVSEIRGAGYKDITADQLVSFKAQGIDKDYISKVHQLKGKDDRNDAEDIVSYKAVGIDENFVNSFKAVGLTDIPSDQLISLKAVGVTPEYVKGWHDLGFKEIKPDEFVSMKSQNVTPEYMKSFLDLGYKEIRPEDLVSFKAVGVTPDYIKGWQSLGFKAINLDEFVGMKSQNVTPEYMKSFTDLGYKDIKPDNLVSFRALNITPEWIRSFENIGYKNIDLDNLPGLKAQNITPEYIKGFEAIGFKNIPLEEIVSVKAVGVTPEYVKDMKSKGFNYNTLQKYVTLKSLD